MGTGLERVGLLCREMRDEEENEEENEVGREEGKKAFSCNIMNE